MTFELYGWIIEYYVFSISPGHGDSGRGRPESRGNAFKKVTNRRRTMRATSHCGVTPYDMSATPSMSGYAHTVQGPAMAMGRWVVETTTALACPSEAAANLEALRACSIIHT